jgi:hypothetical protein
LADPSGFDVDRAERLLRETNPVDVVLRSDMLAALINSYPLGEGFEPLFEKLISRVGGTLFAKDTKGCNAAHRACISHTRDTAALLFLCDMDGREPGDLHQTTGEAHRRRTYLHLAAEKKWHRVVEWLLKEYVDVEQKDMDGKTAWDVAFENNDGVLMSILATLHVARQIEEAEYNEIRSKETKSKETKGKETESKETKSGKRKDKVRRHWFRMNSDDRCEYLMKRFDLPNAADERYRYPTFKLFAIFKNNVGPLLLAFQMNKR